MYSYHMSTRTYYVDSKAERRRVFLWVPIQQTYTGIPVQVLVRDCTVLELTVPVLARSFLNLQIATKRRQCVYAYYFSTENFSYIVMHRTYALLQMCAWLKSHLKGDLPRYSVSYWSVGHSICWFVCSIRSIPHLTDLVSRRQWFLAAPPWMRT